MYAFKIIISTFILVGPVYSQTVVNRCKGGGLVPEVNLSSKDTFCEQPPCSVYPGYSANIRLNFTSPFYSQELTPILNAFALGSTIRWPSNQKNACQGILNTACPLVQGEPVSYVYEMELLKWFPEILVSLEFSLVNEADQQTFICFSVDLDVTRK